MVLGIVITVAGGSGVLAVFSDRATTGANSYASAALPRAADLQLAVGAADGNVVRCTDFVDDLQTGIISVTDAPPDDSSGTEFVCVKNLGSKTVAVTATAFSVESREIGACTGDEEAAGDTSCIASGQGELHSRLNLRSTDFDCDDSSEFSQGQVAALTAYSSEPLFSLAPGSMRCLSFAVSYVATEDQALISQSDIATWRFAFDGATS